MKSNFLQEMPVVLFVLLVGFYVLIEVKVEVDIHLNMDKFSTLIGYGLPILYSFYLYIKPKPPKGG